MGAEWGRKILYPVRIFVCFLHELGHGLAAIFTGGSVDSIQINPDGSGWTRTINGNRAVTIMGGYLGSAVFGNLIFSIGAKFKVLSKYLMFLIAIGMVFTALIWFNSFMTSGILILFALSLVVFALKTEWSREIIMFLGLASVLYIIKDFNIGPSSDLAAYANEIPVFSANIWKYIWLLIALIICALNLRILIKSETKK
jgi:hypothetical protein